MKKVNFKKVLLTFVAVFALMVFGVEQAEAQAYTSTNVGTNLFSSVPGNYLGSAEAQDVLVNEITGLKDDLPLLTPGTQPWHAVRKSIYYYNGIYLELLKGKSVAAGIGLGLHELNDCNGYGTLGATELLTLRQGAIVLLQ